MDTKTMNKLSLLDQLLDDRCDAYGIKNTIQYLFDSGLSKEEILELRFEEEDVDEVLANLDRVFDCE